MSDRRVLVVQARVFVIKQLRQFVPEGMDPQEFAELVGAMKAFDKVLGNGPSITCPKCGWTSYHPADIEATYCGNCHDWHHHMKAKGDIA